jgi:hypothetical protein
MFAAVQYHLGSVVVVFNYSDPCFTRLLGAINDRLIFNEIAFNFSHQKGTYTRNAWHEYHHCIFLE